MNIDKEKAIRGIVDSAIKSFADGFQFRLESEVDNPNGVINLKKRNCFIAELGKEFMFYSAFVRSFDSSFGKVLETMGNNIAKLSYTVKSDIDSFLLPQQTQLISDLMSNYDHHIQPEIEHYSNNTYIVPKNIDSYKMKHATDNYFFDHENNEHYIIELKAGGDLDNKKSKSEKIALLTEYFLLKNLLENDKTAKIRLFFATAYNKNGEGNPWIQERVRQFFCEEELLIGKKYWDFVCKDNNGFDVIFDQYKQSAQHIKNSLSFIKSLYFR